VRRERALARAAGRVQQHGGQQPQRGGLVGHRHGERRARRREVAQLARRHAAHRRALQQRGLPARDGHARAAGSLPAVRARAAGGLDLLDTEEPWRLARSRPAMRSVASRV